MKRGSPGNGLDDKGAKLDFSSTDGMKPLTINVIFKETMMNTITNTKSRWTVLLVFLMMGSFFASSAYAKAPGLVEVTSHNSFGATVGKFERAVSQNGLIVLKKFNQQKMLSMVGVHAKKGMTFEIFHPKFGKNVHNNNMVGFLALPLRVLVLQQGSGVNIYYQRPSVVLSPFGLSDLGNRLDPVVSRIVDEAAK